MAKQKRKLSAKQKADKARLRQEYMWIFVRGKQKRVRRPPTIGGMDPDEFIQQNADPIWLLSTVKSIEQCSELMTPSAQFPVTPYSFTRWGFGRI